MRSVHQPRSRVAPRLFTWLLFGLALYLRTAGISNDWDVGNVYHPDTPKQIRATERFVQGEYYTRIGGRDYEGYPYFASHLVAASWRAYTHISTVVWRHLGLMSPPPQPSTHALYLITRLMNAVLSACTVLLAVWIGRRYMHRAVGWMAGFMLALSPADITAAHYATGDVSAAFFTWCAVAMALVIWRTPRLWAYPLAAVLAAAGFSSKYHGGIAVFAVGIAHVSAFAGWPRLFSRPSIGRGLLFIGSFVIGILFTSPALLVNLEAAFKDILAFLEYTASFGMTAEMAAAPLHQRFATGLSINMPVLWDIIGPVAAGGAIGGLLWGIRRSSTWIIAVIPLLYILAGLATKPLTHPVYHTLATPGFFILAAAAIYRISTRPRRIWIQALLMSLLMIPSLGYLAIYSHRELFFYRHNDTRYLAGQWIQTHLPDSFSIYTTAYTSPSRIHDVPPPGPEGAALLYSPRVAITPPASALPLFHVALETDKLSVFRNWDQLLFVDSPQHLQPPLQRPGFQPLPVVAPRTTLVDSTPWWIQRDSSWQTSAGDDLRGTYQSASPLRDTFWWVRSGETPTELRLSFGGREQRLRLPPQSAQLVHIQAPRPTHLPRTPGMFYPWRIRGHFGSATVHLITDPREQAWALLNAGEFAKAHAWMQDNAFAPRSPGDQAMATIAARLAQEEPHDSSGNSADSARTDWTLDALHSAYGLSSAFWQALPVGNPVAWERPVHIGHEPHMRSKLLTLEPGHYLLTAHTEPRPLPVRLRAVSASGHELARWEIPPGTSSATTSLVVDHRLRGFYLESGQDEESLQPPPAVTLRPDPWHTVLEWQRIATRLGGVDDQGSFTALAYLPFLEWGRQAEARADISTAAEAFILAIQSAPWRAQAYSDLLRLLEIDPDLSIPTDVVTGLSQYHASQPHRSVHPADVEMRNGMQLRGYQIAPATPVAGEDLKLHLHWQAPRLNARLRRHAAWIHIYQGQHDYDDRIHGDQALMAFLNIPRDQDLLFPQMIRIPLPEDLPAGSYQIEVGLWIPSEHQRIRVRRSDLERSRRGVLLPSIHMDRP